MTAPHTPGRARSVDRAIVIVEQSAGTLDEHHHVQCAGVEDARRCPTRASGPQTPWLLRVLVEAGYVLQEREGATTCVSVNPDCLAELPAASRAILAG
jgi:hypothetical protein